MSSSDAFFTTTPPGSSEIPVDPMDWGGDDLETTPQRPQAPAAPPSMKSSRPASPSAPTPDPKRWKGDKDGSDDADDENASQVSRDSTPMHTDDPVAFYGQSGDGSPIGLTGGDGDINSDAKAVFDSLLSIKEWLHYRERSTSPLTAQMCVALAHRITELFEGAADLGLINLLAKDAGNDRTIETLCAVRDACILHVPYPGNPLPSPPFPAPSGGAGPSTSSAAKGKQRDGAKPPATPNSKQTDAAPAATKPVLKRSYARPTPGGPPPPIPRHSRPLPGGTFAAAARRAPAKTPAPTTNTSVEGILALAKVFPELSASEISTLYQQNVKRSAGSPSSPPPSKRVKSTTRGPSRMQIVYAEATFTGNLETVVTPLNNRLASNRRRLRVAQAFTGMGGIILATQSTPTAEDLPVVIDAARSWFPANTKVTAEIPASRSYLKIVNVPFFQKVGGAPITQDLVESRICQDPVTKNFHLASKPRVSRNSPASDSCTVWFDIWDTQSGANLKQLVNKRLSFGGQICMIRPAEKRPGTPQCQRCWKWGHIDTRCSLNRNICAHCGGPHGLQYHRVLGSCCKAKPKANPPVEATHPDEDCPHPPKCVNCGGEHLANAKTCPYFRHRFEPEWIKGRYERDANVNRNYELVSNILEERKSSFDLLLIQEPPWNFIRRTVSATNPEGEAVVGPPIHPDWMVIFRRPKGEDDRPRVMTYVNKRLAAMRPAFRTDLADHRDILVLTLWGEDNTPLHYINVYSDQNSTAINWLCDNVERLPQLQCMAGDFNCHSSVWDPRHEGNNHVATSLIDAASDLGVEVSVQPVRTPTHFPHARGLKPSVIDLMFLPQDRLVGLTHEVRTDWIGPSDHAPLCVTLPIRATEVASERLAMPKGSEEESSFLQALLTYIKSMDISNIDTRDALEDLIAGLARACNDAWNSNAKTVKVNTRSKAWWNADCATAMRQYRQSRSPADYGALRRATKAAKRQFFDERIETIATKNKRPWDLMNWTKQRNLPTYEAIRYNEAPCNTMDDLWQALHATYNAASDRPVKVEVLEEVEQEPPREWVDFSTAELREELAKCSNTSAPGPDHLTCHGDAWQLIAGDHPLSKTSPLPRLCAALGHSLAQMQRKAALWILGAFRTSPGGGVETLAGLPPVHLHIKKLVDRSFARTRTLLNTHPTLSLMTRHGLFRGEEFHPCAISSMAPSLQKRVKSSVMDAEANASVVNEPMNPLHEEATPGQRVSDLFGAQITYDLDIPRDKEALADRRNHLDALRTEGGLDPRTVMVAADASVPTDNRLQAIIACTLIHGDVGPSVSRQVASKATSDDAELAAIAMAVGKALQRPDSDRILVFSDSTKAINRLRWDIHFSSHEAATQLKVPQGPRSRTSLDYARKRTVEQMLKEWTRLFQQPEYSGRLFLRTKRKGKPIAPSHLDGSPWLKVMGKSNAHTARMSRSILNHAPIGEYRRRFNLSEEVNCSCRNGGLETRAHMLDQCPRYTRKRRAPARLEHKNYLEFLEVNPRTFAFPSENPPPPFPKARPKRKPPDQVNRRRLAHRMQSDEGLHDQPACPEDLIWVPELFCLLRRDEAIAAGLVFADQQQGARLLD
ncbi:hypothetical protein D9615_006460 [Tricholomella constricta]|uniref:Endonuclease/exonuclease/phosphatase domain-containing protein n=1 Tax=Tricholomella constricta TaxID=117010 RepID=A0A8H5M1M0_9AGAR|nr:hypothetical protein D9615_006460 [Tricholomella constricta]